MNTVLSCDFCKRSFFKRVHMKKHIRLHTTRNSDALTCDYCHEVFEKINVLRRHVMKMHLGVEHFCKKCCRLFESADGLSKHGCRKNSRTLKRKYLMKKHSKSKQRCRFCYSMFIRPESYETHMKKLTCCKSARYHWLGTINCKQCRICSSEFLNETELSDHHAARHPGKAYACYWCDEQFDLFEDLRNHVHAHVIERFTCFECNKAYTSQEGYRKHRLKHKKSQFKCKYCSNEYLSKKRVQLHQNMCKNKEQKSPPAKLSRQLNWESRIISKKIRNADCNVTPELEPEPFHQGNFFVSDDDDDSMSDRQGWFDEYYKTKDDFCNDKESLPDTLDQDNHFSDSEHSEPSIDLNLDLDMDFDHKVCRLCGDEFLFEFDLLLHFVKIHPNEIPHQCPFCPQLLPLFAQLKEHFKIHGIGRDWFHCGQCSKTFRSESSRLKHNVRCLGKMEPSGEKICKCGRVFKTRCGYKRHKLLNCSKSHRKPFVREVKKPVKKQEKKPATQKPKPKNLQAKLVKPEPADKYQCRLCPKAFPFERGLVMHFKSQHPGIKPLICPQCGIGLADKLKEHLKTHGIGEEFVCELCGKRFNQKFMSKIHEMWHQGIEYKCANCKQKFLSEDKMKLHVDAAKCSNRMSLLKLPCDVCGKLYRSKFGLKSHYLTHTPKELRPVKQRMNCEFCGKWFDNNNGLQRHRRIHTGEKPFCCRYCPKAFAQEGNCKAHERLHNGEAKPRRKTSTNDLHISFAFVSR